MTGIDVLEAERFGPLAGDHLVGVLTNQTGMDRAGRRTVDILATDLPKVVAGAKLAAIFSPEHGIFGKLDSEHVEGEIDAATGLKVTSLYGPTEADKRPTHEELKDLDAVVIDLQDAGVRFYTYDTVVGYFLEAAAREKAEFHHEMKVVVLDRPDLIGGETVQGPVSDAELAGYIDYMPLPVRTGMSIGEFAKYVVGVKKLDADLVVVPMEHWTRAEYFDETGLTWVNPSPNLRTMTAAVLYAGLGFLDFSGVSVGRGTETPFELVGAAWMKGAEVAAALNARNIPGVIFSATTTSVAENANRYPFHGQMIEAVKIAVTDRRALDSPEMGVEILSVLHRMYPEKFDVEKTLRLVGSRSVVEAIERGEDPRAIADAWKAKLGAFIEARKAYLIYP
jgi:uncharacterized protein YbbC (DUF1343 family)